MINGGFLYRAFGFVSVVASAFSWFVLNNNDAAMFFGVVAVGMLAYHTWKKSQDSRFFNFVDSVNSRLNEAESDINHRFEKVYSTINDEVGNMHRAVDVVYRYVDDLSSDSERSREDELRDIFSQINHVNDRLNEYEG